MCVIMQQILCMALNSFSPHKIHNIHTQNYTKEFFKCKQIHVQQNQNIHTIQRTKTLRHTNGGLHC